MGWAEQNQKSRVPISLACTECQSRNYKTTRASGSEKALEIKKYCKQCKKHTLHRESK